MTAMKRNRRREVFRYECAAGTISVVAMADITSADLDLIEWWISMRRAERPRATDSNAAR